MVVTVLSWVYIFIICILTGAGLLSLFKNRRFSLIYCLGAGIAAVTVYTEFFSIFAKTGAAAHLFLLGVALVSGFANRNGFLRLWRRYRSVIWSWEGFFYVCFILLDIY